MHARIIGHADDHTAVDSGVGHGIKRIGRNVQAYMLHAAEYTSAGKTRAEGRLHGNLLVRSPLAVDLIVLGGLLRDLGTRGTRIT